MSSMASTVSTRWVTDVIDGMILKMNVGSEVDCQCNNDKYIVNAILQLYLDEHKTEILKALKP